MMKQLFSSAVFVLAIACNAPTQRQDSPASYATTGSIERLDVDLDAIIDQKAAVEIIAEGFEWTEGPLWVESENMLLFSDIPHNTVYKWTEQGSVEVYLRPSGYTGAEESQSKEPGSNGLLLDSDGNLVLCQHGDRRMARMDAPLGNPKANYITLVDRYEGARFSSPNDAVYNTEGDLFFTDPPYGLPSQSDEDPAKETRFNGVYRLRMDGELLVLADQITRPNGLAFFPGEKKLLIANSDPKAAIWYVLDMEEIAVAPKVFYDATEERDGVHGLPDGLKINKDGVVFSSGPGGVWIFDDNAKVLGKIRLEKAVSNVALSDDEKTLYITQSDEVLRVNLK